MAICKCYVVEIFVSGFEWSDQNQIRIRPLQKKINDWTRFFSFTWPDQNTCIRPDMDLKLYYILFSRLHFHLYPYPKHHVDSHSADNPESGLLVSHFFFLTDPDPDNKNYKIQIITLKNWVRIHYKDTGWIRIAVHMIGILTRGNMVGVLVTAFIICLVRTEASR